MNKKTFEIINRIAKEHCHKTFGYLDEQDLQNEIWLICLERLDDFEYERGELEHFLRVSVKNRLVNRFKDITKSVRSPCPRCPYFNPDKSSHGCLKFAEDAKGECQKWRNYQRSIESRNNLLTTSEQQVERGGFVNIIDALAVTELRALVESKIEKEYRHDLDQLISGGKLSKQRLKKLKVEIHRIINNYKPDNVQITVGGQNANSKKR